MSEAKKDIRKRTFKFAVNVVKFYFSLPANIRFSPMSNQLLKAGTSIGANIEEAQGALTRKDFIHSVNIAKKETRETVFWLKLWIASNLPKANEAKILLNESEEIRLILTSIVKTAQERNTHN
jgi:four helix bundle protein